jgi:hypothetical protein
MKRIDFLVSMARVMSENEAVSTANDIADEEFIQKANDAQDRLQSIISNTKETGRSFGIEKIIDAVANQDGYSINDRIFFSKSIDNIEFSYDGSLPNYRPLKKLQYINRVTSSGDWPTGYYRRKGMFFPVPILNTSSGKFRVIYERSLDDIDKRRATVDSVAGLTSTTFTSMVLSNTDETSSPANLTNIDYICVCDADGIVKAYNIPVDNFNTSTKVLTPRSGFTFLNSGETIEAGDYVTFHKWTTTHSQLCDECESYILEYIVEAIKHRDSSNDFAEQSEILKRIEKTIVDVYKKQSAELQEIPQLDETEWYP